MDNVGVILHGVLLFALYKLTCSFGAKDPVSVHSYVLFKQGLGNSFVTRDGNMHP